jgi:hypothetical protein
MFKGMKIKTATKFVAKEIPKRLILKYGRKSTYEQSEIDWALTAVGKDKEKDKHTYYVAYAMLADKQFYLSLGMTGAYGDIDYLHKIFTDTLAKSSSSYSTESALSYSESFTISNPSFGSESLSGGFSGDSGGGGGE